MLTKEILDKLQLHGRTLFDEEKQALFCNWTCSGFTAVFDGSVLKARFTALGDKGPAWPGMPEERRFRVVIVRPGAGTGLDRDACDVAVTYTGALVRVDLN